MFNKRLQCGVGKLQNRLTTCSTENFCALPREEIGVYGTRDVNKMTIFLETERLILKEPTLSDLDNLIAHS